MRTFLTLLRFFVWTLSLAAVITSIVSYFDQYPYRDDMPSKTEHSVKALVWIFSAYFVGRAFDLTAKSLEELLNRLRLRRKRSSSS
jgi:hypothetical protein